MALKNYLLFFPFFLFNWATLAQGNTVYRTLYWFRYYNQTQLTAKTFLHVEVDERRLMNPDLQFQLFMHIHLHRRISKSVDLAAGFTYARTNSSKSNDLVVPELRPFQEVNYSRPLFFKIQGQVRYRLDERFIHNSNKIELQDGYTFVLRHRFRFQLSKVLKKFESGKILSAKISDEIMLNSHPETVDTFGQNRVYGGLELQLNKNWSTEIGYLNLYQAAYGGDYLAGDIVRCTVYHRLSLVP